MMCHGGILKPLQFLRVKKQLIEIIINKNKLSEENLFNYLYFEGFGCVIK
jgi:hypothetical protein